MIARPRSAATNTELPASLVLTSRELKHYRRFQAQTTNLPPKSFGRLPTAAQYADFQAWLAKRDSGYLSDTPLADIIEYVKEPKTQEEKGKASLCGHTLHPVHKEKAERCPVCTVEIHTNYMRLLNTALEDAGGQMKQRWESSDQESPALQAWYAGKLAFVKEISRLESFIKDEEEYNQLLQQQKDSPVTQSIGEAKTASQALVLHWNNLESSAASTPTLRRKKSRSVIFCPDTNFDSGRDQLYFWRRSPRYEAGGKYSSDDSDELDVDHLDDEEILEKTSSKSMGASKVPTLEHEHHDEEDEESEEGSSDEESDDEVDEEEDEDEEEDIEGADFIVFG